MSKKKLIPLAMILTTLLVCVPVLALRVDTVVIGGGWIIDEDSNRANFAFNFDSLLNGQVQYSVSGEWQMSSTEITDFIHRGTPTSGPTWVQINGLCRVKDLSTGETYDGVFQLEVEDFGVPGGKDIPHEGEENLGDWIIMYVWWEDVDYISMVGTALPPDYDPLGQHIDGGNILHMGQEAQA